MRRILIGGLAALSLLAVTPAAAAPSEASLALAARYVKAVRLNAMMEGVVKAMLPTMMDSPTIRALPVEAKTMIAETTVEVMAEYTPRFAAAIETVVAETLTEEELSAAVTFYESPIGQSIVGKSPQINERYLPAVRPLMTEVQQTMLRRILDKLCDSDARACSGAPARRGA